jgi:hypothetical protein
MFCYYYASDASLMVYEKKLHVFLIILPTYLALNIVTVNFIISGCTVLVRTLAASHRRFRILIKTLGRTPLDE